MLTARIRTATPDPTRWKARAVPGRHRRVPLAGHVSFASMKTEYDIGGGTTDVMVTPDSGTGSGEGCDAAVTERQPAADFSSFPVPRKMLHEYQNSFANEVPKFSEIALAVARTQACLLYTSDAADE